MSSDTSDTVDVRLEATDFSCEHLRVRRLSGREAISELFRFDLEIVSLERDGVDSASMLGAAVSIVFLRDGAEIRRIPGMISEVDDDLAEHDGLRAFRIRVVPRAFRLTMVETQDVFLDATIPAIVEQKLKLVDLAGQNLEMRLTGNYPVREFVVEYKETDLAFVSRLTEHLGISFFFDESGGRDVLVFTDHPAGFRASATARFRRGGERRDVFSLVLERRLIPAYYVVRDYNYRTPLVSLDSDHTLPDGYAGGVVEQGGHFKTPAEGKALAQARAEERQATQLVYVGKSDVGSFGAGARVKLDGHPDLDTAELLLVEVEHLATLPVAHAHEGTKPAYENRFRAVPAANTYRPPRRTPRPRIAGLVTGVIDAGTSATPTVARIDEQGRYTVRFHFDFSQPGARAPSRPVRMAQHHVGQNYGTHFPLKPGTEVVIGFIDGDPDRPVILGAVPNPITPSPVDQRNPSVHRVRTGSGITVDIQDGT